MQIFTSRPKIKSGRSREDYKTIILSYECALRYNQIQIKDIAAAHGLYTPTAAKVFTEMKAAGIMGPHWPKKKYFLRSEKSRNIMKDILKFRGAVNLSALARKYGCSREYVRQVRYRLYLSGKISKRPQPWD